MNSKYKNTYVINMDKVLANRNKYVMYGNTCLPIIKRNDQDADPTEYITGCSETCIANMVERFHSLSKKLGKLNASTVVQYLDKGGMPIVTLYPTGEADVHNHQWGNFAPEAQRDLLSAQMQIRDRVH